MKVWYCEEHKAGEPPSDGSDPVHRCYEWWIGEMNPDDPPVTACRFVPMRLIPDNAETLDREVLAAALGRVVELEQPASWSEDQWQDLAIVEDAALEYLTQLPEQCATCGGSGHWTNRGATE